MSPIRVVLDANVLFPEPVREIFLAAAGRGWIDVLWSDRILKETLGSLVRTGWLDAVDAPRLRERLERMAPRAMVSGWEHLEADMHNAPEDRHVAAVAVHAGAVFIITRNLRDFRKLPPGLRAQAPDVFLRSLLRENPLEMEALLRGMSIQVGWDAWLTLLAKVTPGFAREARVLLEVERSSMG